jgi:hypothetical protein
MRSDYKETPPPEEVKQRRTTKQKTKTTKIKTKVFHCFSYTIFLLLSLSHGF